MSKELLDFYQEREPNVGKCLPLTWEMKDIAMRK